MNKITALVFFSCLTALSLRADVLFQDSTNYPYTNGCIEGQGQWYCYLPRIPVLDALVTNNILILNSTNTDSVGTPTNGWANPGEFNYASFTINVSQLPATANGGYFCEFMDNSNNNVCHIFIDTVGTVVPGTYRLGIANFAGTFNSTQPPINYPLDLATGVTYNVVFLYDTNQDNSTFVGGTLWINPSEQDYDNVVDENGVGYVYGNDITALQNLLDINISQIGFSPYISAGISNVIVGTSFDDVNSTNLPVMGIQPQSGTNYSGNNTTLYSAASGVDLTYQWYSSVGGMLSDDGVNIIGSTSNVLVLNNLSGSANYYVVATDAYGKTATSATATNTVITTPTPPFFTFTRVNLTNNLFASTGFTNVAEGTGPLFYQWFFAPTNTPTTFTQLVGQTSSSLVIPQLAYAQGGSYFVSASNAVFGGSITAGPTNSISVIAPVVATLPQLHTLMAAITNQIIPGYNKTIYVNSNNVTVSGYVSSFGATTATTTKYSEFYIQNGASGIEVFYSGAGITNTAVPPPGSYVTVSGPCEVFDCELEITPTTNILNAIVTNTAVPVGIPAPQLGNFNQLVTNPFGQSGITADCSLVTFTNMYIYAESNTAPYGIENITNYNGGIWKSNNYSQIYMTQGLYDPIANTNIMELYVPAYLGSALTNLWNQSIPTYCYQLTGIWENYKGTAELEVTRYQDFVTNAPPSFAASVTKTSGGAATIGWSAQPGSTYSVYSATNLLGPWIQTFGLAYYPSTGAYTDTNFAQVKFYRVSTP
jgi:hypothetical protein